VLAVSSQHLSVFNGYDSNETNRHHQACLELLIPQLSEDDIIFREDILAATVILRLRAEFEGSFQHFQSESMI
jgi:hypothetical protein